VEIYLHSPYAFTVCCLVKQRGNFTYTFTLKHAVFKTLELSISEEILEPIFTNELFQKDLKVQMWNQYKMDN